MEALKQIIINGTTITEGEKFQHVLTGVIYEVKKQFNKKLQFDNGIIHVDITPEKLNRTIKIVEEV